MNVDCHDTLNRINDEQRALYLISVAWHASRRIAMSHKLLQEFK